MLQARGSASWTPDKTSVGQAVKKLESLITQLDSLLPYLGLAINAVNLLSTGERMLASLKQTVYTNRLHDLGVMVFETVH